MFGLRSKILTGFGGLLLMLVAISVLAETVLDRYGNAMGRSFREDYDSVAVCQQMKEAVEGIDVILRRSIADPAPGIAAAAIAPLELKFADDLRKQRADATLSGEPEQTEHLATLWDNYRSAYRQMLDSTRPLAERQRLYADKIYPLSLEVRAAAQSLIDMNMQSVLSVHGRQNAMAASAKRIMDVLGICAVALALIFAFVVSQLILGPVRLLTQSAQEVERGNLDQAVPVRSRDELGALATAFNAMAAQLRSYRQRESDRLARTEHTTQLTIDSLPDAVVLVNPAGQIELTNDAAKRLFSLKPGTSINDSADGWLPTLYHRAIRDGHSLTPDGYDSTVQVEMAGESRFFLPRAVPIHDESKRVIGATVILADVTGLRRLDEMKNGLLSLVSHELKTPLTSMRMVLHLVADQKVGQLSAHQHELLSVAKEDSDRLHEIVESLLDMSRIESGKALMELRAVSAARVACEAADRLRSAFNAQQTILDIEIPADLPGVLADAARVGYVVANLLSNALRHTTAGGRVTVRARPVDGYVEFSVEDDGEGIPQQYLHRVFEKFFRVPGQSSSNGSGLGLAIAREIIEAHGGQMRVQNNPSRGTTFAFTLRAVDEAQVKPRTL